MEPLNSFIIKVENQQWLDKEEIDLCSHGEIHLNVNGTVITQSGIDEEWGISETALALLRTMDGDYICDIEHKMGLILHGCGTDLMVSCPISIHWTVKHVGDEVELSDFVKVTTTNPATGSVHYAGLIAMVSRREYKSQIFSFAKQAKKLFEDSKEKHFADNYDEEMYKEFWREYNELLKIASS